MKLKPTLLFQWIIYIAVVAFFIALAAILIAIQGEIHFVTFLVLTGAFLLVWFAAVDSGILPDLIIRFLTRQAERHGRPIDLKNNAFFYDPSADPKRDKHLIL